MKPKIIVVTKEIERTVQPKSDQFSDLAAAAAIIVWFASEIAVGCSGILTLPWHWIACSFATFFTGCAVAAAIDGIGKWLKG
jgi:hypothetical protein